MSNTYSSRYIQGRIEECDYARLEKLGVDGTNIASFYPTPEEEARGNKITALLWEARSSDPLVAEASRASLMEQFGFTKDDLFDLAIYE